MFNVKNSSREISLLNGFTMGVSAKTAIPEGETTILSLINGYKTAHVKIYDNNMSVEALSEELPCQSEAGLAVCVCVCVCVYVCVCVCVCVIE